MNEFAMTDSSGFITGWSKVPGEGRVLLKEHPLIPLREGEAARWNSESGEWEYSLLEYECEDNAPDDSSIPDGNAALSAAKGSIVNSIRPFIDGKEIEFSDGQKIAVLIPCCGKAAYIEDAVKSCLAQQRKADEIIILLMDSESAALKDRLESLSPSVQCHVHSLLNSVAARNLLASITGAEWIVFLDADDMIAENFISTLASCGSGAVRFAMYRLLDGGMLTDIIDSFPSMNSSYAYRAVFGNLTSLMSREAFLETGLDESLCRGGEDTDFILRLFAEKKFLVTYTKDTFYMYRQNVPGQLTSRKEDTLESQILMMRKNSAFLKEELGVIIRRTGWKDLLPYYRLLDDFTREGMNRLYYRSLGTKDGSCRDVMSDFLLSALPLFRSMVASLARQSRSRQAAGTYSGGEFTAIGCTLTDRLRDMLRGRAFDAVFLHGTDSRSIEGLLLEEPRIIVRNSMVPQMLACGTTWTDRFLWLLRNSSCFFLGEAEPSVQPGTAEDPSEMQYGQLMLLTQVPAGSGLARLTEAHRASVRDAAQEDGGEEADIRDEFPEIQRVVLCIDNTCNMKCRYCQSHKWVKEQTDEELYKNFDQAMTLLEEKFGRGLFEPKILGGEPTIWSGWLQKKTARRLRGYRFVSLFTNRSDESSELFTMPNITQYITHIVDWKSGMESWIEKELENEIFNIVIAHGDIPDVPALLADIQQAEERLGKSISACLSMATATDVRDFESYAATQEDMEELYRICTEAGRQELLSPGIRACIERPQSISDMRLKCAESCREIQVDCTNGNRARFCCDWKSAGIDLAAIDMDKARQETEQTVCPHCVFTCCNIYGNAG